MRERSALIDEAARPLTTTDLVVDEPTLDVNIKGTSVAPFSPPTGTHSFTVTYPTTFQTVYRFYSGAGGTGTLLRTITLNFSTVQTPDLTGGDIT